jgi:hypothetical protein
MEEIDYGVCRLSSVPVRKKPTHPEEQVTQLLFGDHYTVTAESPDRKWIKIRIHYDQYEGWISRSQHQSIAQDYFNYINHAEFRITTDITDRLKMIEGVQEVEVDFGVMTDEDRQNLLTSLHGGPSEIAPAFRDESKTRIIAVVSGKGGVGKSTVAVNLASALDR